MKKHSNKIIAAAVALLVLTMVAADSFWGGKTVVATIHGETNYFAAVLGDHTASVYRKISPSNVVNVLNDLSIPRTNLAAVYFLTNALLPAGSVSKPSIAWALDDDGTGTGFYRSSANQPSLAVNGVELFRWDSTPTMRAIGASSTLRLGDSFLSQDLTGNILQMGNDSGTPTATTLKGSDGSGSNIGGGNLVLGGGQGTGTGAGGAVVFSTSTNGAAASTKNGFQQRHFVSAKEVTLTESTATTIASVTVDTNRIVGIRVLATTHADDGTDFQSVNETFAIAAVNKAGTITTAVSAASPSATLTSSGTLVCTWTADAGADGKSIDIKNSAVSSLTQTTLKTQWRLEVDSDGGVVVTPQ